MTRFPAAVLALTLAGKKGWRLDDAGLPLCAKCQRYWEQMHANL